ncbi:FimV/HubP family polar landmark protein [Halomonas sp. SpR1]|uniref:type IV pilus assembly protein FimV n=1 Tax=Halomonas sp. SpR1 TaxID=3050462 RepID=UPI0027E5A793|nr:FimV/HubP family polar landmark protein [Halomonas sp. SpR1]MDQ7734554.1 FimV/HubP family polar landmark protein [Halomonas sp. SpR1]
MKKILTWMTWLSLSAVSPIALAIGLGQASVSSYLNAPLDASIPLIESSDYALDDIRVSVADPSDFATAGLEWTPLAASVRTQVVEQQGQRQVRLSSDQAMQEPWLDLLLTVEFPGGEQFRDITLLFDPQGYSQQGQRQTASASAVATPVAEARHAASPGAHGNASSAYIGSGDTLWSVAERIKPGEVSVQQMMVALLEANPEVFPSGNINDMRAGQTLRIPDAERVLARSHDDADVAIKAMNEAWRLRRNGSLQAVSLPELEPASVADTSIAPAQTLHANARTRSNSALAAGGSETVVKDSRVLEEDEPGTDGSEPMDQSTVEAVTDAPEALTRMELTEQLRLSQVTLQQVLEERELMRAELNQLRGEVASLTQALGNTLTAQEQTDQEQSSAPLIASMDEMNSPGVAALIERYQWPLALGAIVLLVGLLVWLRKRREETWEEIPLAEPVVKPTVSPRTAPKAPPMPEAVSVTYPGPPHSGDVDEPHNDSGQSTTSQSESEPEPGRPDTEKPEPTQDYPLRYDKSQASGLAEQGRPRRLGLTAVPAERAESVSLAPPQNPVPVSQLLASLEAGLPASDPVTDADGQQADKSAEVTEDPGHRFIDYHPPVLNSASNSFTESQDGLQSETPMQPTVEFSSEPQIAPLPPAKQSRRPIEEEWEIEEVAFKPRGLDNSDPSKSPT